MVNKCVYVFIISALMTACNITTEKNAPEIYFDFSANRICCNDTCCKIHVCTYDFGINVDKLFNVTSPSRFIMTKSSY
jgi:hypothetical protein